MTCLVEMHMKDSRCNGLIEETAVALNDDIVALMFLAVQRGNTELSVKVALSRWALRSSQSKVRCAQWQLQCLSSNWVQGWRCSSEMSYAISMDLGEGCYSLYWWHMADSTSCLDSK